MSYPARGPASAGIDGQSETLGGTLYVTYENEGSGGGVVDAFDPNGNLLRRVTANGPGGPLESP